MRYSKVLLGIFAALVCAFSLSVSGMALAQDKAKEQLRNLLRSHQNELMDRYNYNAEKAELLQQLLDEGRTYTVLLPTEEFFETTLATKDEAKKYWKLMLLKERVLLGRPLDEDALRETMKNIRASARNVADQFEREIPMLLAHNKRLKRNWQSLEDQIAELMADDTTGSSNARKSNSGEAAQTEKPVGKSCAALVEVVRADTPLSQAASTSPGASTHSVTYMGEYNRHPINIALEWSVPPAFLCTGDEFQLSVRATNAAPTQESISLNYLATASLDAVSGYVELISCSDASARFSLPKNTAVVKPDESTHSNSCTYKVIALPGTDEPKSMIEANLGAHTGGVGTVLYRYAAP